MSNLKGKIAWITGAGSGIGLAAAQTLADAGAIVVMSGRRKEVLAPEAEKIRIKGGTAEVEAVDVSDAKAVKKVADGILARPGRGRSPPTGGACCRRQAGTTADADHGPALRE